MGADVLRKHSVKQGLVAHAEALGLCAKAVQRVGVQADGDELPSFTADRPRADDAERFAM